MRSRRAVLVWLVSLCALVGGLGLGVASAGAALVFPSLGEISGPEPGRGFGHLDPESVAVNDFNGHILVADSSVGRVYDFTSAADTAPGVWDGAGTPAGSFGGGRVAVAVDNSTGDVYVADTTHLVVDKFDASGALIETFGDSSPAHNGQLAGALTPAGSFSHPGTETGVGIAVDQATHELYVIDAGHRVIDVFSEAGVYQRQITETPGGLYSGGGVYTDGIAVSDFNDRALVSDSLDRTVYSFGTLSDSFIEPAFGPFFEGGYISIAVNNASGRIYVAGTRDEVVKVLDGEGNPTGEEITGSSSGSNGGVAVGQATGDIYVSAGRTGVVKIFGPTPLVIPDVTTGEASGLTSAAGQVTLNGVVNPDGVAVSSCEFEYGPSTAYGSVAPCAASPGSGGAPVAVSADVTGLKPGAVYHYRLVAGNANGQSTGFDESVLAPGVAFDGEWASGVASTSATLSAQINPGGSPTVYRFEYGSTAAYGQSAPVPDGDAGSGVGDVTLSVHLQGLLAGSTYHYRVTAAGLGTVAGTDQTFTTQAAGGAAGLADGRQWEMVSPPDKHAALLQPLGPGGYLTQAAPDGSAMLYTASAPVESEPQGNANKAPVLSVRGAGGWGSRSFVVPHETSPGGSSNGGDVTNEWRIFSEDLSWAVVRPVGEIPPSSSPALLSGEASEQTAFLHTNDLNGNLGEPCVTGCYRPLVTGEPGYANVLPGTVFGMDAYTGESCFPTGGAETCGPQALRATPDLSHVVLQSRVGLTEGASGPGLYEWAAGKLTPIVQGTFVTANEHRILGSLDSVSGDGSRIVFRTEKGGQEGLLMRDITRGETVQLDAVQSGGAGPANPGFVAATGDGARVLFTDSKRLTSDAGASEEEPDLYECEMVVEAGGLHCRLSDLTLLGAGEEHANVMGVLGTSGDGSWVYFVAGGVLGGSPGAVRGQPNLYVRHDGVTRLVAVLSGGDSPDWNVELRLQLANHTARVSPDGEWLAFMSQRSLTGYDNRDALTGSPDEEVYLYRAGTGALVCVSCNPTDARPVGVEYVRTANGNSGLSGGNGVWPGAQGIAGNVPGWTSEAHQSRYLSDQGRLFFNSSDALVPRDVNRNVDVYEYEPPGVGGCGAGSVSFSTSTGGCVGLISSGTSPGESAFLDASESGGDVFFLTAARLTPQDVDSVVDVYDAHECTAGSPCLAASAGTPPPCATSEACKPPPAGAPGIFGAPASASFSGRGNLAPAAPVSRPPVRVRSRANALRACRKKARKQRRVCERRVKRASRPAHKANESHGRTGK